MATMKQASPRSGCAILYGLGFLAALAAVPPPQGSTPNPLTPTQTPVPFFPPSAQPFGEWVLAVLRAYGAWFVIGAVLLLLGGTILLAYSKGWLEWITEAGKQDAERMIFQKELSQAGRAYLQKAAASFAHLKFRGLPRHRAEGIEPPSLDSVYVSLQMTPEGGEEERVVAQKGQREASESLREMAERKPVDLAGAIGISPRLALVGPAGCGKSTLLQWAGLRAGRPGREADPLAGRLRERGGRQRAALPGAGPAAGLR